MRKFPLRDLDEARRDPVAYRHKLDYPSDSVQRPTYFNALRDAILKFHKTKDVVQARAYLEDRLTRFTNVERCKEILAQFEWYAAECVGREWPTFETRLRVVVPLPARAPDDIICSGEVSRVDLIPSVSGYAAWLMRQRGAEEWFDTLHMPLIQDAVARQMGAPISEVHVGVYSFAERMVELRSYEPQEIAQAYSELDTLFESMGF